jgi:hypothetical protein
MTLNYGIFDVSDPQNPDRVYSAALLSRILSKHIRDGVVHDDGNEMAVTVTDPPAMRVLVGTGTAMIRGRFCENDAALTLAVTAAHATYPRIDRVVVRLNASPGRTIDIVVKAGTAAPEPAAPALTRTAETWELSLAQVRVEAGATSILSAKITDERGNSSLCGVAAPVYVPSSQVEVVGAMNMQGHALTGLPAPSGATDAARKEYVDTEIAGAIGGFGISQIAIDADKNWGGKNITNVGAIDTYTGNVGAQQGFIDSPGNTTRKSFSPGTVLAKNETATVATITIPANYSSTVDSNLRITIVKSTDSTYDHYLGVTIKRNGETIGSGSIAHNVGSGNIDTTGGCKAGDTITVEAKNAWGGTYDVDNITIYTVTFKTTRRADIPAYKVFAETGAW